MRLLIIGSMILLVFTLFGCSSSDTSTDITVLDGYIKGATVTDNRGQIAVETNALKGLYTFAIKPVYPIRTTGGIIVDTNETFDLNMIAYSGHVISPISTFIGNNKNLTNNLKQSLGFLNKDDMLDDYIVSNNLPLAKVSELLYAVLKDPSLKQAFQNKLEKNASDDLFTDAIEDLGNSPIESVIYIDDLLSYNSNEKGLETFLKNDKNNLSHEFNSNLGSTSPEHPLHRILFAHGLNADKSDWDSFINSNYIDGWKVYAFNVDPIASIKDRATSLANQINAVVEDSGEPIPDDSLIVVGHSMGGLDLHYIISKGHEQQDDPSSIFYKAAKKFYKFYTIASPHKGNEFGGVIQGFSKSIAEIISEYPNGIIHDKAEFAASDAAYDLGLKQMQEFNKQYPYTTFKIDNRKIPLMALRFACWDGPINSDGVVAVQNQSLNGAPHSKEIYNGEHMGGTCDTIDKGVQEELKLDKSVLNDIILQDAEIPSETHDIVFYEGNDCSGDEKGVFSSSNEIEKKCTNRLFHPLNNHNDNCDNDEIRSVKIFPGVKKNTIISVYDDGNYGEDDDWAVINTGNKDLTESVCINSFESSLSDKAKNSGITKFYHEGPPITFDSRLDGKVSSIKIKHSFEQKGKVLFYQGDNCTQNLKGKYNTSDGDVNVNCKDSDSCTNDSIRSVLIFPSVANDTIIKLYDDPDGSLDDDSIFIYRGNHTLDAPFCIKNLEHDDYPEENEKGIHTYYRNHNGLNGKVSRIRVTTKKSDEIAFFEGNACTDDVKGDYYSSRGNIDVNCKDSGICDNDEISSVLIFPDVTKGTVVELFDDPDGRTSKEYGCVPVPFFGMQCATDYYGWAKITVKKDRIVPVCLHNFNDIKDGSIEVYRGNSGEHLEGKVSHITIRK